MGIFKQISSIAQHLQILTKQLTMLRTAAIAALGLASASAYKLAEETLLKRDGAHAHEHADSGYHNFNKFITKQLIKNDFDVLERFPSPPDEFTVEYAELINESRHLKMDKMKRNIVFAHMNAEESSALIRQFVEFCPEN